MLKHTPICSNLLKLALACKQGPATSERLTRPLRKRVFESPEKQNELYVTKPLEMRCMKMLKMHLSTSEVTPSLAVQSMLFYV